LTTIDANVPQSNASSTDSSFVVWIAVGAAALCCIVLLIIVAVVVVKRKKNSEPVELTPIAEPVYSSQSAPPTRPTSTNYGSSTSRIKIALNRRVDLRYRARLEHMPSPESLANGIYQSPESIVYETFDANAPAAAAPPNDGTSNAYDRVEDQVLYEQLPTY
jgi:hypothetical protein